MILKELFALCFVCIAIHVQASSDDKFIKKYAMMKIYESCFGSEVVKQIRQEMKEAYAKCAAPSFENPLNQQAMPNAPNIPPQLFAKLPPGFAIDSNSQTITRPENQQLPENDLQFGNKNRDSILLALRLKKPLINQQQQGSAAPPYMMPGSTQYQPFGQNTQFPQNTPFSQNTPFVQNTQFAQNTPFAQSSPYGQNTPFYQFPYSMSNSYYQNGLGGMQYNPFGQYPGYQQGYYQQPYLGRRSRDMDLRERLDLISRGNTNAVKARNITCVMQELGYIDDKLEPNYEKITERISNLPVSTELKGDIQDGLQFCQKFSQCVPDLKRNVAPLSQELVKPMFFFRCYKHKKLEACIMKDIRERFTSEDEFDTDADFRSLSRSGRSIREDPLGDPRFDALDEMAVYLYDYLSGANTFDFDLYM